MTDTAAAAELTEIATGLRFPEGPIAMPDGSVVLVEMFGPGLHACPPDGSSDVVAEIAGRPQRRGDRPRRRALRLQQRRLLHAGRAAGPAHPGPVRPRALHRRADPARRRPHRRGDRPLHRVRRPPAAGAQRPRLRRPRRLLVHRPRHPRHGGARTSDRTGIYYARCDGSAIREVVFPVEAPNGIGLSPDGAHAVLGRDPHGPGLPPAGSPGRASWRRPCPLDPIGAACAGCPGCQLLDSLAVDGDGNVCVATLLNGGITVISPDGGTVEHVPTGDPLTTNICFGGDDLRTAYITLSGTGRLRRHAVAARRACASPTSDGVPSPADRPPGVASNSRRNRPVASSDVPSPALLHRDAGLPEEPGRLRQAGRHAAGRRAGGRRTTRAPPTSSSSTPARSSRTPARSRSTRSSPSTSSGGTAPGSSSPAAWPSATATSWPPRCPRSTRSPASACRSRSAARRGGASRSPAVPSLDLLNLPRPRSAAPWAYVKIAEGCDRTCGFCAIPSFRGPQRSRDVDVDPRRGRPARGRGDRARRPGPGRRTARTGPDELGRRRDRAARRVPWPQRGRPGAAAVPLPDRPDRRA